QPGEEALSVVGLTRKGKFYDCSFTVRRGEIVGLAGLVGAGRTELARAVFGVDPIDSGEVRVFGKRVRPSPSISVAAGMGLLPEDRKADGLALILPLKDNVVQASLNRLFPTGIVSPRIECSIAKKYVDELKIATPTVMKVAKFLSGGTQQKVVLAKWLCSNCKVLLFDEPTRGIDVGAKAEIYRLMDELAGDGAAILMISSELPELLGMSDRILVMKQGRIVKEIRRPEATQEIVMRYAMGKGDECSVGA
ncbi:MAG: ATP-binding cassette domain-containing protein, partial [Anaerolineae bacterium]